jgi:precorrin-2 dehydrogenase/sirohydrochlorin ferrochelatase
MPTRREFHFYRSVGLRADVLSVAALFCYGTPLAFDGISVIKSRLQMGFIPIFLQIEGRPCLIVGGGEVASRKVKPLLAAGATVTVISPQVTDEIQGLAGAGRVCLLRRPYRTGDMKDYHLVYATTGDRELQRSLSDEASRLNILINVADAPGFCSFIAPSVVRRGRLQVAISTAGASPAFARRLRQRIEQELGDEIEVLLELMAGVKDWLKQHEPDRDARARKLNALADSELDEALRRGDRGQIEAIIRRCLGSQVRLSDLGINA